MVQTYRVLAQRSPGAASLEDLFTATTETIVSSLTVCNTNSTAVTFRIRVAPAGAADATSQALYHEVDLPAEDTFIATVGLTLANTDVIRVQASATNVAFHAYGTEET